MDKQTLEKVAYAIGYSLGLICLICIGVCIIALVAKFLFWLF